MQQELDKIKQQNDAIEKEKQKKLLEIQLLEEQKKEQERKGKELKQKEEEEKKQRDIELEIKRKQIEEQKQKEEQEKLLKQQEEKRKADEISKQELAKSMIAVTTFKTTFADKKKHFLSIKAWEEERKYDYQQSNFTNQF